VAKRAVVIGVNEYQDKEKILPLQGAENDAKEISASLNEHGKFEILHCLIGPYATFANVRQAMSDLFWRTDESELDLFYFSGHGFQDGYGEGYIAPFDIKYSEPFVRGIRIGELRHLFLASKGKQGAMLILDSCHSGVATEGHKGGLTPGSALIANLKPSEEEAGAHGTGRFILASSRADQRSKEISRHHEIRGENDSEKEHFHGVFSFHLLEGLNGRAANQNNEVTLGRLHTYLTEQMKGVKDQERTFWGFGAGPVENTVLVKAGRRRELEELYNQAEEHLREGGVGSLFNAIECLHEAIQGFPDSPKADPLKMEIDNRLPEYGKAINTWRKENPELRVKLSKYDEFLALEGLAAGDLSFARMAGKTRFQRNLFLELIQVSLEKLDFKVLERDLRSEMVPLQDQRPWTTSERDGATAQATPPARAGS